MLQSFAILMTLIIDNPQIDEEMEALLETNFWTLCEYSYSLFKGIIIRADDVSFTDILAASTKHRD